MSTTEEEKQRVAGCFELPNDKIRIVAVNGKALLKICLVSSTTPSETPAGKTTYLTDKNAPELVHAYLGLSCGCVYACTCSVFGFAPEWPADDVVSTQQIWRWLEKHVPRETPVTAPVQLMDNMRTAASWCREDRFMVRADGKGEYRGTRLLSPFISPINRAGETKILGSAFKHFHS